jgi:FtsP/CotA-like multicopper oxidase with cupredoxin domain
VLVPVAVAVAATAVGAWYTPVMIDRAGSFLALILAAPLGIIAPGCASHDGHGDHGDLPPAPPLIEPEPWTGDVDLPRLEDLDPDPDVVEVELEARPGTIEYLPGKSAAVWTYNGSVPGPLLEANVGNEIVVRFTNNLPEPTTIHWHGMRVPAAMDGTAAVQQPVPPGGTFEYRFRALDAGTFWYHPHVRTDVQVQMGLYGAIVIRDPDEPAMPAITERVLLLSDALIDPDTGELDPRRDMRTRMMGLEGNLVLVNGRRSNVVLPARAGRYERWRIVNGSSARYYDLAIEGGELVQVGTDGGLLEAPRSRSRLLLTPGERADVLVGGAGTAPGGQSLLRAAPYERAHGAGSSEAVSVLRLAYDETPAEAVPALPAFLREISPPSPGATVRTLRLGERMTGESVVFLINGQAYPDVTPIITRVGEVETWEIIDETGMDHPFHLHGFSFQVLSRGGVTEPERAWKDTVNVRADETLRIAVAFDDRPGHWMYHCHILEHEEGGMMGHLDLRP